MIILGPSQEIKGETRAKLMLVSIDYNGVVEIRTPYRVTSTSSHIVVQAGFSYDIDIHALGLGRYDIEAIEQDTGNVTICQVNFLNKYGEGRITPQQLEREIIDALEKIDVTPHFKKILPDKNGDLIVQSDRQFFIEMEGWEHGDIFGTYDVTFRLTIGYLGDRLNDDGAKILEALRNWNYPQGVAGVDLRSATTIEAGERGVIIKEYMIYATIWFK